MPLTVDQHWTSELPHPRSIGAGTLVWEKTGNESGRLLISDGDEWVKIILHPTEGPSPWADPRAYGAKADAVKSAGAASTTRGSSTVTISTGNFKGGDTGKLLSIIDLTAPTRVTTGAMTSGLPTLTVGSNSFSESDVGKEIEVSGAGNFGVLSVLRTTISAYVSPTQVTLAANAQATVSNKIVTWKHPVFTGTIQKVLSSTQVQLSSAPTTSMTAAEVTWGTDDTAAVQAAINASGTGVVRFSGGSDVSYLIAGGLNLKSNLRLETDGAVVIRHVGNTSNLFTTPAGAKNVTLDHLVIDCQHVAHTPVLYVTNASTGVTVDSCEFRDIGQGRLVYWQEGSTQHTYARVQDCRFVRRLPRQGASYDAENVGAMGINDCSYVYIVRNDFVGIGAVSVVAYTPAACTSTSPMRHIHVESNSFQGVMNTTLWLQAVDGTYLQDAHYDGNTFVDCGYWSEKGNIFFSLNSIVSRVSISNNKIRGGGALNTTAGYASPSVPALIGVSTVGTQVEGVDLIGNTIDGRLADGTTPGGLQAGISVLGSVTGCKIANNAITYVGWNGIMAYGVVNGNQLDLVIDNNTVRYAGYASDNSYFGAGISVFAYAIAPQITNNTTIGCGLSSGAAIYSAGIMIGGADTGGASPVEHRADTVTTPILRGNVATDATASRQNYGILLGKPGGTYHPSGAILDNNVVSGNITGSIVFNTSADRAHTFGRNPGYNTAHGHMLYSGSLASAGTATFAIPTSPLPFAGLLIAEVLQGDNTAVNFYYVWRHSSSGPLQAPSASLTTISLGATAPTIASTTPSSGTFTVTNQHAFTSTIRVFLVPLAWGAT